MIHFNGDQNPAPIREKRAGLVQKVSARQNEQEPAIAKHVVEKESASPRTEHAFLSRYADGPQIIVGTLACREPHFVAVRFHTGRVRGVYSESEASRRQF